MSRPEVAPVPAMAAGPRVGVVMGSRSDWATMRSAAEVLAELGVPVEVRVVSAHRTPLEMVDYGRSARGRGIGVIVAGAGGAAHLPGMLAALTTLPVVGVPVPLGVLDGLDSLLSIVQMPAGVPVATVAVGNARNGGLLAARILSVADPGLAKRLDELVESRAATVAEDDRALSASWGAEASSYSSEPGGPL